MKRLSIILLSLAVSIPVLAESTVTINAGWATGVDYQSQFTIITKKYENGIIGYFSATFYPIFQSFAAVDFFVAGCQLKGEFNEANHLDITITRCQSKTPNIIGNKTEDIVINFH